MIVRNIINVNLKFNFDYKINKLYFNRQTFPLLIWYSRQYCLNLCRILTQIKLKLDEKIFNWSYCLDSYGW